MNPIYRIYVSSLSCLIILSPYYALYAYNNTITGCLSVKVSKILAFAACIGAFSWGNVLAWTGPALPHIAGCLNDCDFHYTADQGSWIASLATLGCMAGCFANGFIMDILGRKWTITVMAVPFVIGWVLMLMPHLTGINVNSAIWIFYVGRSVLGKFHFDCVKIQDNFCDNSRLCKWCLYSCVQHIHF